MIVERQITSKLDTSRYFARSVGRVHQFDRVTTMNLATSFTWHDSTGVRELREYFGNVILLFFWNTTSPWSAAVGKEIMQVKQILEDSDVVYIGITQKEVASDSANIWRVQHVVDDLGLDFPHVLGNSELGYAYGGIDVLPTIFVINRYGKIHSTLQGKQSAAQLEAALRKALAYEPIK